jgi:hypothetical protein
VRWALGETGHFGGEDEPLPGQRQRRYWWRPELRLRAGLREAALAQPRAGRPPKQRPKP